MLFFPAEINLGGCELRHQFCLLVARNDGTSCAVLLVQKANRALAFGVGHNVGVFPVRGRRNVNDVHQTLELLGIRQQIPENVR